MSVPEMEVWEGLPFLWPGQDFGEVGPIESSSCVRQEPYPLPQGFEWCTLNSSNFDEISQLDTYTDDDNPTNLASKDWLKWVVSHQQYDKNGYLLGIRLSSSKKLVWFMSSVPCNIRVGGKILSTVYLQQNVGRNAVEHVNQLYNAGFKETMRILGSKGIFQAVILIINSTVMPNPIIKCDLYVWHSYEHSLPYSSPRTVGLRKMKESDIPKAFSLTNQYTSQFAIGQVFQSEEEFSHYFLSPLSDNLATYVVEEPSSGNITDLFNFRNSVLTEKTAMVSALVITNSSPKQIITDLLLCAIKKHKAVTVILPSQFGLKEHLFENFIKTSDADYSLHYLLYNYRYPTVNNDNHCLFGHIL